MTVREAFEKLYGPIPEDATCHIGSEGGWDLGHKLEPTIKPDGIGWPKALRYRHLGNTEAWEFPIGPDIADRPAYAFRGFFGEEFDRLLDVNRAGSREAANRLATIIDRPGVAEAEELQRRQAHNNRSQLKRAPRVCPSCGGSGRIPEPLSISDTGWSPCPSCNGRGRVSVRPRTRVIFESGRYVACLLAIGLTVQSKGSWTGKLMPPDHPQYTAWVDAMTTVADREEGDMLCRGLLR